MAAFIYFPTICKPTSKMSVFNDSVFQMVGIRIPTVFWFCEYIKFHVTSTCCQFVYRKWLQIKEISVRRMSFRQNEMLERNWAVGLTADPPIWNCPDVVLTWQRFKDWNCENNFLSLFLHHLFLRQQQVLVVVNLKKKYYSFNRLQAFGYRPFGHRKHPVTRLLVVH